MDESSSWRGSLLFRAAPPGYTPPRSSVPPLRCPEEVARRSALDRPRLSVVVVNYVHWDDTARLVRQLRRSSAFGREAEVVIVDNHSPPHPIISRLRRA